MLIVGAGGFAKEVLEVLTDNSVCADITFFDDINPKVHSLYDHPIISSFDAAAVYLKKVDNRFILGIGGSALRLHFFDVFTKLGGICESAISVKANIASFGMDINSGVSILGNSIISSGVSLGRGSMVYYGSIISHDVKVGEFCEISPGATILGGANIGKLTHVGANATVLPRIKIGENVIIGAGSVVTKDIPNNKIAIGIPAKFYPRK
ncbi:NeuD/PglB/VioB family sugar acetyltransferase [Sphingobacterium chungjuense]|uniref:NeuD/PglB/VioB family sugar acetyltransferase n=1 Tax=Sphingobacterium chungjuense TaxID=2675553 RepID=UPI00140932E0|nr:NeuD/PglB/VioB family sugar acetyltransferase [Sphingobacterium chungjuense]